MRIHFWSEIPVLAPMAAAVIFATSTVNADGAARNPLPEKAAPQLADKVELLSPSAVELKGYLGTRVSLNATNRLLRVDEAPLLAGFRQKPGSHPWIGEHVGKWLHATTLAWANTGDPALRAKLDTVAAELVKAQEPDGYLGTYTPGKRFGLYEGADWDVWSHKYNLMGLLTYYQYTGNETALTACRKMGDLLINTFGPGKKSIISAGTHVGMAATSVLEPMVLLYRLTGNPRYLEFCKYIVASYDEPNGPKIVATLLAEKSVQKTANAKAYEMLSNLVGLSELARATGEEKYIRVCLNAWEDIVAKRLYLTGSASQHEHFGADHNLPNGTGANMAETCVTTTWIQLNLQLLRLTGEARFASELERTLYNHLSAAQRPDGAQWCYYTALEGRKPYGPGINCCVSSGPRGMALAPQAAYVKFRNGRDSLGASLYENSRATVTLNGQEVTVEQQNDFPASGTARFTFRVKKPAQFAFLLRIPPWTKSFKVSLNNKPVPEARRYGWALIAERTWTEGDQVAVTYDLGGAIVPGDHTNLGKAALRFGPMVLAYDQARNPGLPAPAAVALAQGDEPPVTLKSAQPLTFTANIRSARHSEPRPATLVPFADAGSDGGPYRVWIGAPGATLKSALSLLAEGEESRSRSGNREGSILDEDLSSYVVTFNNQSADEDWYAVTLAAPSRIARVVYAHGNNFHDGGWMDAGAGKPRIQVQRTPGGPWETVGELADYPSTSATNAAGLKPGQTFTLRLPSPVEAVAVRVIGKPACGDNPKQAFSSCAELQAFGE